VTTGTKDRVDDGEIQTVNTSPRSVFEGPMFSGSTMLTAPGGTDKSYGNTVSLDSLGLPRNSEENEKGTEDYEFGSGSQTSQDSGAECEESNLRRSARNHQSSIRRVCASTTWPSGYNLTSTVHA
jgi:hypothetical protein